MNGVEQRAHRTVTQSLDERVSNMEAVVVAMASEVRGAIGAQRTRCQERWVDTGRTTKQLADNLYGLRDRSFWGRLRWLVRGY